MRPLIWADEFYMYGPGKDWVGIERIPRDTVMGYWKYWPDYAGIGGLLERGYDVLGISAMYNHTFYLADLSPRPAAQVVAADGADGHAQHLGHVGPGGRSSRTDRTASSGASPRHRSPSTACGRSTRSGMASR